MAKTDYAGGYTGTILSIDLTNNNIEKTPLAAEMARDFIGGHGLTAKLTYDLIKRGTEPLSPENILLFGAGPLVGTMAPTGSRATAMAKSPLSGLIGISNAGHFGAMLKFAGYDELIIKGRAENPVYLKILDDEIEFVPAAHLWGKDVPETVETIRREIGENYWVTCIGPAGENLVKFAGIISNAHSAFGRTGMGAVMGSKNLKAIAIYGRKSVKAAKPGKFMKYVNRTLERMRGYFEMIEQARKFGTQVQALLSPQLTLTRLPRLPDTEALDADKYLQAFQVSPIACSACPVGCKAWLKTKGGTAMGASCTYGTVTGPYGVGLAIKTYEEIARIADLGQRLGLDSMVTASMISYAIEMYQDGVITKEDTGGLDLSWGDTETILELIRLIALRKGLGDILAEGMDGASSRIGRGSERYASHVKGLTMQPEMFPDIRAVLSSDILGCFVNPRGWHIDTYRRPNTYLTGDNVVDVVREWGPRMGVPEEAMKHILTGSGYNIPLFTKLSEQYNLVIHSLGTCDRHVVCLSLDIDMLTNLYSAATGIETAPADLLHAGERILNVEKAFNIREGASRKDDQIPDRLTVESIDSQRGKLAPANKDTYNAILDEYYEVHGWDKRAGIPTRKKLTELGLEAIAKDLDA